VVQLVYFLITRAVKQYVTTGNPIGAGSVAAAREAAWMNSEILFTISAIPLQNRYEKTLDGLSQLASKALLALV
jgi:hypothetical protein